MLEINKDTDVIIAKIRSGKKGRDEVIERLYYDEVLRNKIRGVIRKYGAKESDFEDVLTTTLMQFVKTVVKNKEMQITSSLHAYLCGISKYVWMNHSKKANKIQVENIDDQYDIKSDTTPESLLLDHSRIDILNELLGRLGKNCREVLLLWANDYSMKEIAKAMNYKSDNMAKKKKYQCFKEVLDYLEKHPELKNILR
ncbi:MAG: sigma-70 family RNA polymerase sigma factor [Bacteroidota bacterium]